MDISSPATPCRTSSTSMLPKDKITLASSPTVVRSRTPRLSSMSPHDYENRLKRSIKVAASLNNTSQRASDITIMAKVTSFALEFINRKGFTTEEVIAAMVAREYPGEGYVGPKVVEGQEDHDDEETLRAESEDESEKEDRIHQHDRFEWPAKNASLEERRKENEASQVLGSGGEVVIPSSV